MNLPSSNLKCLNNPAHPSKRVLFLGYNQSQTSVIDALIKCGCYVDHTEDPIDGRCGYDFVVSFGYRHILRKDIIEGIGCPIFNLHISYLPYNRGAHPNFWSFFDNTPSGVTIHLIDEGVDTGSIVFQKYVNFDAGEQTFVETYARLIREIESLFVQNLPNLLADNWSAKPQRGVGTHHFAKDLPSNFSGWNSNIEEELARLDREGIRYNNQ